MTVFVNEEDCQIYSPESTDGKTDWPTVLVSTTIILVVIGIVIYSVYKVFHF